MNNKITFSELVDLVAQNASTSKRMSELFLKELFATISQALTNGESVTVKGIGTFKLASVSARKSVNVNTGEEIEIPGHNKLSFAADKDLAAAINQPFAHFETEILDDNVTDEELAAIDEAPIAVVTSIGTLEGGFEDDTETTEEEVSAEEEVSPAEEEKEEPATPEQVEPEPTPTPVVVAEPEQLTPEQPEEEAVAEPELEPETEPMAPEAVEEPEPEPQPEVTAPQAERLVAAPVNETDKNVDMKNDEHPSAHHSWLEGFVLGVISTLIVTIVTYRLFLMNPSKSEQPAKTELAETLPDSLKAAATPETKEPASPAEEKVEKKDTMAQPAPVKEEKPATQEAAAPAVPEHKGGGTDVIQKGTTLFKLATKHYGNSVFWVYIYEENKARFSNPNTIPVGTVLNIPAASKYGIDKNNAQSVATAKKKQGQIFNEINKKKK